MASVLTRAGNATQARLAVAAIFTVHGAVTGSFAARIPWIADHLSLSEGRLGLALIMPAVGSLTCMPLAGQVVRKLGGPRAARLLIAAWCAALMVIPLAPSRWWLMALLLVAGSAAGMSDVAMNAEGVAVEQALGRSVMSSLHGMWSVGGLLGAGLGAGAAKVGLGAPVHFAVVGAGLAICGVVAGRWLLPAGAVADATGPRFSLPRGPVLIIGLIGFCAVFAEGATAEWCALYLRRVLGAGESAAAWAYGVFALAMAVGRLSGDIAVARFGAVRLVRLTGIFGLVGGVLVVTATTQLAAIAGFAMIGLGIAIVVPLAFSAAGHAGKHSAHAIAGVATVSYGAGLAAPGLIGGIASLTSLPMSFALVTALIGIVVLSARRLAPAHAAG